MDKVQLLQDCRATARTFSPLTPQDFLVFPWSTSERWGAKSSLEPPSDFEPKTSGLGPKDFLVFPWSTLERWEAKLSLEPPSDFEPKTSGLGMQHANH